MLQLRYTGFFVPDVPTTVAFYQAAFGVPLRYMHQSRGYAELETGATLLVFISEGFEAEAALLGGRTLRINRRELQPVAAQLAFIARDLDDAWQRAIDAGAEVVKLPEIKPWGKPRGTSAIATGSSSSSPPGVPEISDRAPHVVRARSHAGPKRLRIER